MERCDPTRSFSTAWPRKRAAEKILCVLHLTSADWVPVLAASPRLAPKRGARTWGTVCIFPQPRLCSPTKKFENSNSRTRD